MSRRRLAVVVSVAVIVAATALGFLAATGPSPSRSGDSTTSKKARLVQTVQAPKGPRANVGPLPAGWTASTHSIRVGRYLRSFLLVRPAPVSGTELPVLIVLHGRGMTPALMARASHLVAAARRAILVFPAGYERSWNAGACCGPAHRSGVDDVGFLSELTRQILATEPDASRHRVYLVGYSNGGRMAYLMACQDPGAFAGVVAVEAVPVATCAKTDPTSMMIVASQNDPLLSIGPNSPPKVIQGYTEPTVSASVQAWRRLDGCSSFGSVKAEGDATVTVWSHCAEESQVEFGFYHGGSHAWPNGRRGTPSAQALVWDFLRAQGHPATHTLTTGKPA